MRDLHHASLALALSLAVGCASNVPHSGFVNARSVMADGQRVFSKWKDGGCSFDPKDNMLHYSSTPAKVSSLRLDVQIENPALLLCSDLYSVVLTGNLAVVSLGATGILSGREFIGRYGERFTFANSYHIDISEQNAEGVASTKLLGSILAIDTRSGRRWSIDLSDPQEWSITGPKTTGSQWQDVYSPLGRSFYLTK